MVAGYLDLISSDTERKKAEQADWQKKREEAEKKSKFNFGELLPMVADIAAAPFTGGASLADLPRAGLQAVGEGVRAGTGSDVDMASIAGTAYDKFAKPQQISELAKKLGLTGKEINAKGDITYGRPTATKSISNAIKPTTPPPPGYEYVPVYARDTASNSTYISKYSLQKKSGGKGKPGRTP